MQAGAALARSAAAHGAASAAIEDKLSKMLRGERFVRRRGAGYHVMLGSEDMSSLFLRIRSGDVGARLKKVVGSGDLSTMSNLDIWLGLLDTLQFDGVDFEHTYGLVDSAQSDVGIYSFPETIVLAHTLLLVPVVQRVAPLNPKLPIPDCTFRKDGQPIVVVGMVGDCVKGSMFTHLQETSTADAAELLSPRRLGRKIQCLLKALGKSEFTNISLQATLPGSGAFGGDGGGLAKEFVLKIDESLRESEVCQSFKEILLYGPPAWYESSLEQCAETTRNCVKSVGFGSAENRTRIGEWLSEGDVVRFILGGFDPVSVAPHGVQMRAVSLEGQLSHATDLLDQLGHYNSRGSIVEVRVEKGDALQPQGSSKKNS